MVQRMRQGVLSSIAARIGQSADDLARAIIHEPVNTPQSWRRQFNLDRGAILGLSNSFFNVLCFRPKTKHPQVGNLFFVGASTHPGNGVPVCLASSKITSEQILRVFGMPFPWANQTVTKQHTRRTVTPSHASLDRDHAFHSAVRQLYWPLVVLVLLLMFWMSTSITRSSQI